MLPAFAALVVPTRNIIAQLAALAIGIPITFYLWWRYVPLIKR